MTFTDWWSIISTVIGVVLLVWDVYLLGESKKEKEIHKSQVKIWQHYANGISNSSLNLGSTKFDSTSDLQEAIKVLQTVSFYLYKSLNEERLFSDEEVKQQQIKTQEKYDNLLSPKNFNSVTPIK